MSFCLPSRALSLSRSGERLVAGEAVACLGRFVHAEDGTAFLRLDGPGGGWVPLTDAASGRRLFA